MFLSVGSFITTMFFSSIMISLILLVCTRKKFLLRWGTEILVIATALVTIRLLLPVEFLFAKTLLVRYNFPTPYNLFRFPLLKIWDYQVKIWDLFLVIWIIVGSINLVLLLIRYHQFKKSLYSSTFEPSCDILKAVTVIAKEEHGDKVRVLFRKNIQTPLLYGLINPVIVLPMISLSLDEWCYILKHEGSHLEHRDIWFKLTLEIVKLIYWWNPLIHLLCKNAYKALEIRADQNVISKLTVDRRIEYADCLLKVAKQRRLKNREIPSLFFDSVQKSTMFQRIQLILNGYPISKQKKIGKVFFAALLSAVMLFSTFFVLEAYMVPEEVDESTFTINSQNAFLVISEEEGKYDLYVDGAYLTTVEGGEGFFEDLTIYESQEEMLESIQQQSTQDTNTVPYGDMYFLYL